MESYLCSLSSNNKIRVVHILSYWDDGQHGFVIKRFTGQLNGKMTEQPDILIQRGKASRTLQQQLDLQWNSECKKYLDKGYKIINQDPETISEDEIREIVGEVITNQNGIVKPMLCKKASDITNPKIYDKVWLASRKINGVRCLMYFKDGKVHTASRGGEHYDYSTTHLIEHPILVEIFNTYPTLILDSELFKFGKSLQQCSGAARLEKNAYDCDWLEMYCYDCLFTDNINMSAKDRIEFLNDLGVKYNLNFNPFREWNEEELKFQLVPHIPISGWDNIKELHDIYVADGWEGLVIRDPDKAYKPNSRGQNMIKIKEYLDDSFLVVGYELGLRGSEDMTFILQMSDGRTFKASPLGDRATKAEYVENFEEKYKNHLGDCKYFELSDEGIPVQGKFICFRFDLE